MLRRLAQLLPTIRDATILQRLLERARNSFGVAALLDWRGLAQLMGRGAKQPPILLGATVSVRVMRGFA